MTETTHWYVTIADHIESTLQLCSYSTVIDQHPTLWANEHGHDLLFAMPMPPGAVEYVVEFGERGDTKGEELGTFASREAAVRRALSQHPAHSKEELRPAVWFPYHDGDVQSSMLWWDTPKNAGVDAGFWLTVKRRINHHLADEPSSPPQPSRLQQAQDAALQYATLMSKGKIDLAQEQMKVLWKVLVPELTNGD